MSLLLRLLLLTLLLVAAPSYALENCNPGCTPWVTGSPCARKDRLRLRLGLDLSVENYWGDSLWQNASYAFCPGVDKFQLLNLQFAALYSAGAADKTTTPPHFSLTKSLTAKSTPKYLSVYGFGYGNISTREWPPKGNSTSAVEFATNGISACNDASTVAVVSILVLDVGLHKGLFNYIGGSDAQTLNTTNPNYNATLCASQGGDACVQFNITVIPAVDGLPAKTGFVPTCKYDENEGKDICLFDSNSACVGSVMGQKNCGTCYGSSEDDIAKLANASTQVFVSYYGTDSKGRALTSGGLNPLNYLSLSGGIFSTISEKLKSVWGNDVTNFSDYFTDPNFPWN